MKRPRGGKNEAKPNANQAEHSIARYAKRGRMHTGKSSFKPPHVKRRLTHFKNAEAVVIILASGSTGVSFPQADTWECWATELSGSHKVGFCLYVESAKVNAFWQPFVCPLTSSTAWGEFPLVKAELDALMWAERTYTSAKWFYVVSGDSIPVKTPEQYCDGPSGSVLGFPRVAAQLDYGVKLPWKLYEHSQWKVLTKAHAVLIVTVLIPNLSEWRKVHRKLKKKHCCAIAPDEWVIGTFLRSQDKHSDFSLGMCMMELEIEDEWRECCQEYTGHARQWKWEDLIVPSAFGDPSSWALRKLPITVGKKILKAVSNKD